MNNKTEINIDEVVSGVFFVELKEQQEQTVLRSVMKAVKTLFRK